MSADLCWMIIRNNHAFLYKKRNIKIPFSSEPGNIRSINSKRFNGVVNKNPLVIKPVRQGEGIEMQFKTAKYLHKPRRSSVKRTIKGRGRPVLAGVRNFFKHSHYKNYQLKPALRRASAILRSQKEVPYKSKRAMRKNAKAVTKAKHTKSKKTE